ncbi:MAG: iron-containing redox enzyme family protein [Alphaproteobacteria bacterium]|nr:iron-containing redox enzyme family protein [Alphaproteobacteria bacterium]
MLAPRISPPSTTLNDATLYRRVQAALYDADTLAALEGPAGEALVARCRRLATLAFDHQEPAARLAIHRVLYALNMGRLAGPERAPQVHVAHPLFARLTWDINQRWQAALRRRHAGTLHNLPSVEVFPAWIRARVQQHRSNVTHPLFRFLRDDASLDQVREFIFQETPLEMLFGDIVAMMLPGLYGPAKAELAENFWDEVGRGVDAEVHRNLRQDMARSLGIPDEAERRFFEGLTVEELVLVNTYLSMAADRGQLTQLIGMLLATENMIPGRFEFLIEGMRRLGVSDEAMTYLILHTTVDVGHAEGWMEQLVIPLLQARPELLPQLTLGVLRRLDAAGAVCDRLFARLQEVEGPQDLSFPLIPTA